MIGEEVYFLSGKNEWQIGIVTGTTDTGRELQYPDRRGYITEEEQVTSQAKVPRLYQ